MIKINLSPEYIMAFGNFRITNTFFTAFLVSCFLSLFAINFYLEKDNTENPMVKLVKVFIYEILKFTDTVTGDRNLSKKVFPIVATFFIFIFTANLLALLPGFLGSVYINEAGEKFSLLRSPNSDLTITLALAVVSVLATQYFSFQTLGVKRFLKRFINFSSIFYVLIGFVEALSEAAKVLSFSFRLFGNIFAGEVILIIVGFLVPYLVPIPFMILEVFVGIIQALIFSLLTVTFVKSSTFELPKRAKVKEVVKIS